MNGKGAFEALLGRFCDTLERICDAFIISGRGIVVDSGKDVIMAHFMCICCVLVS